MKTRLCLLLTFVSCLGLNVLNGQGRNFDHVQYQTTDVGHGIYMLVGEGGNIGLCVGEDGVFLIDDQFAPLTPKLLTAIAKITDQPVDYVINTHWHGDHTGGNANLAKEGALIVAHDNVRARMSAPGRRQSPKEALPVITFSETTTFHLNGHEIHAFHPKNAHTDGDAIIHFKDVDVIHAGDVLFNGMYPFIDLNSGGSVDGYLAAMNRLADIAGPNTKIIAGHGPIAGKKDVQTSIRMLEKAKALVAKEVATGKNLEAVQAADPLADLHEDWAWAFITGERFTEILYNDLSQK